MKGHKILLASVFMLIPIFTMAKGVFAKIPEPDNIIYGLAKVDADIVGVKVNGQTIASYTMRSDPGVGEYTYVLRIPLDALDPQEADTARPGDAADIYINSEPDPAVTTTIGQRGSIQEIDLATEDSDFDGLLNVRELQLGTNPHSSDTDGDGLPDSDEVNIGTNPLSYDTDGDGYSDGYEVSAGTNPLDETDIPVMYVDFSNTSGIEDGSIDHPYNTINEGIAAAPAKYTVLVASGIYEEEVAIDKAIRLVGESPTRTVIDAGAGVDAVYCSNAVGGASMIKGFKIQSADNAINCSEGASPLIRNNVITGIGSMGIICGGMSTAKVVNNAISGNTAATAIQSSSSGITVVNNIISGNDIGVACIGGATPRMDYNNVWNNTGGDYIDCTSGIHDISEHPSFVDISNDDFHLSSGSPCIDAGDPMEMLASDYTGGSTLAVNETTNIAIDDRVWITDGAHAEADIVVAVSSSTIDIHGQFMNDYTVADGAYIFTDTSDGRKEPEPGDRRIDMGAYGNTDEAVAFPGDCEGDFDVDGDVDGSDLATFAADFGRTDCSGDCEGDFDTDGDVDGSDLATFAADFGRTDCIPTNQCRGDFDVDGDVDGSDLAVFAADFGRTDCSGDCEGDFDTDGDVDGSDLAVFAADFGRTDCP